MVTAGVDIDVAEVIGRPSQIFVRIVVRLVHVAASFDSLIVSMSMVRKSIGVVLKLVMLMLSA
jgi:hypothetical protein